MELSHSLTLNEEALSQLPETKQPVFVFEWLRFLDKVLLAAQKSDIRGCQRKLVDQLTARLQCPHGPPTRRLIARCLATLFSVGDTFLLFDTVNKCNDILRHRDDTPSYLSTKLAAIAVLGCMYERLGRMMGRSYEETVQILTRSLKNAESQMRAEIMATLEKLCAGMGTAITSVHKDVYKACRHGLTDRAMSVRCASARCLLEMLNHNGYQHQQTATGTHQAQQQQQQLQHVLLQTAGADLEGLVTLCFRAFDASNYEVHCAVAKLLGTLMAATQQQAERNLQATATQNKNVVKTISLEEALGLLMSGFLRGGVSFLKGTGEMIKGSSGGNREVRVGVTHAYVVFAQAMGGQWLERNITAFLTHILDLVANPKAASSHVDAVYSRKCISFILHSVLGKMLGEKAQASACKEIAHIIVKQMNSIDFNPENAKDCNQETLFGQHLLVCALQEMGRLILGLGTQAQILILDPALNFIEATVSVLVHPCQAARLAAAWCLRCICIAVPSEITPLVDRCVAAIENMSTSPEAIAGHSGALCAVLSSVRYSPLGIPHTKGKIVFNTAEELLRSASQNSRLSLNRTQAGWLLIGSIMTLGTPVVKGLLPRMLLLWRNSFPRSAKELESEKARGDAFTWQVTLEGRAGALSAMHSFLLHCPELITDEYVRRLLTPIESALAMLISISSVLKSYGQQLKAPAAMVRLRMYEALYLLPPAAFEGSYTHLLRMLVSEFTLGENPANTTTSQLQAVCHSDDYVILGSWLQATDHRTIEDQLQPNSAAGSGALEHDPCCLYRQLQLGEHIPGPLPLGVAVIDMSVSLFGQIFPYVANKHRLQMLDHFSECIKMAKASRQEAVQMNVFTALLMGLKGLTDAKSTLGQEEVKKSATALIVGALTAPNPILRCAAGEAVGRISQVVQDSRFTAEMAQTSFDRLKSARDVASRTGHSLALGCLHRYVGSMGTSQHLTTSVSILLALAQDLSSPTVQVWSLHALALIADSGGPMFRGYVEPTLSVALKLLLDVSQTYVDVHQCIGKLLSALITTIGPELQGNTVTIAAARSSFLCACSIMHDNADPSVRAEATGCLQQLHLFAPRHVNLSSLVPMLCRTLASSHLLLRKAAVSCLRQLAQREAKEICEHAATLIGEDMDGLIITESGLPGVLFGLLDSETDTRLVKDIHDTLLSMLQMLAAGNLTQWLALCKSVLTIASETSMNQEDGGLEDENDDDQMEFHAEENKSSQTIIQPRWPTRVFAAECVQKIIIACESDCTQHFDLLAAKEMQLTKSHADFLVLHLSDLIRMAFMAITSDSDQLRLEGLKTLQEIIDKFAKVSEPEFPGHLLLEQFQAQIDAALRHVFSPDTPSHVTAAACDVCSTWIRSGVARDLNDLRRVHQLLVSSLGKLNTPVGSSQLYNESMATLEKLSILKAWAEVYTAAMIVDSATLYSIDKHQANIVCSSSNGDDFGDFESRGESLLILVQPELADLSGHWLAALRDHALLSLPAEFASQLPHDGGAFYTTDTMESSRVHYASRWPAILHAAALWISNGGFEKEPLTSDLSNQLLDKEAKTQVNSNVPVGDTSMDRFYLLFGICMEALCGPRTLDNHEHARTCLQALHTLLDTAWARNILMLDRSLAVELCNVLHRLIITRDTFDHQFLCTKILQLVIKAANENLEARKKMKLKEMSTQEELQSTAELDNLGEGGSADNIAPGQSLVFAILEVCLCLLVRQIPALNPSCFNNSGPNDDANRVSMELKNTRLNEESGRLVATVLLCMESLPRLCSPEGALAILPTILYLTTGVFKETVSKPISDESILADTLPVQYAVKCLRSLATDKYGIDSRSKSGWARLLQSALGKLIDLAKTGSEKNKIDETAMMQAIAVFVLHSPSGIVNAPNLLYPCINHFRQCLQSENNKVKLKCVQTLKMIFEHTDRNVVTPYIHALAPRLIAGLYGYANPSRDLVIQQTMLKTMDELNTVLESITTVEALIALAEPSNRIQMLTLLVPILIGFLLDGSVIKLANKNTLLLHEHSLQWLMKIGPKYAQEFKALMSQASDLRLRLETAIREQTLAQQSQQQHDRNRAKDSNNARSQQSVPTIKLKTDFSNFS